MDIKKIQEMKKLNGVKGSFRYKAIEKQYYKELKLNFKGEEKNNKLVQKLHCMWQLLQKNNVIINIYEDGIKIAGDSIEGERAFILWEDLEVFLNRRCKLMNGNIEEMNHDDTLGNYYLDELYMRVDDTNEEDNTALIQGLHCIWQLLNSGLDIVTKNTIGVNISNKPIIKGEKVEDKFFVRWSNLEEEMIKRNHLLLS